MTNQGLMVKFVVNAILFNLVFVSKEFGFKRMSHTSGIDQIIVGIYLDFQK